MSQWSPALMELTFQRAEARGGCAGNAGMGAPWSILTSGSVSSLSFSLHPGSLLPSASLLCCLLTADEGA